MIVFRICAVRLFFVWLFFVYVFFRSGTQFSCACGNAHFLGEGVVWQTRVCSPACCQVVVLYRKPSDSLPARREPTPGCKQSRPGRTRVVTTGVHDTAVIEIHQ